MNTPTHEQLISIYEAAQYLRDAVSGTDYPEYDPEVIKARRELFDLLLEIEESLG